MNEAEASQIDSGAGPDESGRPDDLATYQPRHRPRLRAGLWLLVVLAIMALFFGFLALGLTGRPIKLPTWVVVEAEARLNADLRPSLSGSAVSIGAIEVMVDSDWIPRLRLDDTRLLNASGATVLALPEVHVAFDPAAAAGASVRVRSLRVVGASVAVTRAPDGSIDFSFGNGAAPAIDSLDAAFKAVDRAFALPALSRLKTIEAEALALSLNDQRSGKVWEVGDGRFVLQSDETEIAAELGFSLVQGDLPPAQAVLGVVSHKGSGTARISATVDRVAAADLAAQATPLAWLRVLDAPISGRLSASLDVHGVSGFDGVLEIGAGALRPNTAATPITFERAGLQLNYDPLSGRIDLGNLTVQSDSLRLSSAGQFYLVGADGNPMTGPLSGSLPASFLGQIQFSQVTVDPAGLFQQPVQFSSGALDLRLTLNPFQMEIGQLSLVEDGERISASGDISADAGGWLVAMDFAVDQIGVERLLSLWPLRVVPKTREWLEANVSSARLFDVNGALRLAPGVDPKLSLGYEYRDADIRFIKTLPPITKGYGHATVEGKVYTVVLDRGTVTPPVGGSINVLDAVLEVPDITQKPAEANIVMHTESSLTAALSLLDQPPFRFLTKADRPVDLGEGRANLTTTLNLPLRNGVKPGDVTYKVRGRLDAVSSDKLVAGKVVSADVLNLEADPKGLTISGQGKIGNLPFDGVYVQGFGPEAKGKALVSGRVTLSQAALDEFRIGLPKGFVTESGPANVQISLEKGRVPIVDLQSDLVGVGLSMSAIGLNKAPNEKGSLVIEAELGQPPSISRLDVSGGGVVADGGTVSLRADGGFSEALFARVQLQDWLDAPVRLTGRGAGKPVAVSVEGGVLDLQKLGRAGLGGDGGEAPDVPLTVRLDRLKVASGIDLKSFHGVFNTRGGFNGNFDATVNGSAAIVGTVIPSRHGTAVRLQSGDAGKTFAAAGIFSSARGGALDMTLTPRAERGVYDGTAKITDVRVRNDNILAELLNAISVIGLLNQLNGEGILFNLAEANFVLTPDAVSIQDGYAIGASLGVSLEGLFNTATRGLKMQGVISPVYMVNGIGSLLTRRGEGLIGFTYGLEGTSKDPVVSVNPLSILTPGMFRELFRQAPPSLKGSGG